MTIEGYRLDDVSVEQERLTEESRRDNLERLYDNVVSAQTAYNTALSTYMRQGARIRGN